MFLLGRPGSGKTTAFNYIKTLVSSKGLSATRFREYEILREMMQTDPDEIRFRPTSFGGFDILDTSVFFESANRLERKIQELQSSVIKHDLIFIELARDNYSQAMKCFSPDFLKNSYYLFIEADVETCIKRIHWRVAHPRMTDNHFVSEHILRSYYTKDNLQYMRFNFRNDYEIQKEVMVIHNIGSIQDFVDELRCFISLICLRESINDVRITTSINIKIIARPLIIIIIGCLIIYNLFNGVINIALFIVMSILAYCLSEIFVIHGKDTMAAIQLRWNSTILERNSQKWRDFIATR